MNFINCLFFLVFIAFTNGEKLIDPWRRAREDCRKRMGLTREQLAALENDLDSSKDFLVCIATELGHLRKDGTIDVELEKKNLQYTTPPVMSTPATACCRHRIYKGQIPPKKEIADYFFKYVECFKTLIPDVVFKVMGIFRPPVYPPVQHCHKDSCHTGHNEE